MTGKSIGLIALAMTAVPIAAKAQTYTVAELGTPGPGYSISGEAINDSGQVAGTSSFFSPPVTDITQATVWNGTIPTQLGSLPGSNGGNVASGINNVGQIVGYASDAAGNEIATVWNGTKPTALGDISGEPNGSIIDRANGIDNAGVIVGFSGDYATVWNGTRPTILPSLGGVSSALAINNAGQIVGWSATAGYAATYATLWQGSKVIDLGSLGGTESLAAAINDRGQIVGQSSTASGSTDAFLYSNGVMRNLGTLAGGEGSIAVGINNAGQIVGTASMDNGGAAFLYSNGKMINLDTVVNPGLGLTLFEADAINNKGQILAFGYDSQINQDGFFVLTPNRVPEMDPASAAGGLTLLLGSLVVLRGRR